MNAQQDNTQQVTLTGVVVRQRYADPASGWRALSVRVDGEERSWVGVSPSVDTGDRITATGVHAVGKHGPEFRMAWMKPESPTDAAGVERYLASGQIPGIGPVLAKRITEHFGAETFARLDADPSRVLEVPGIGEKKASKIAAGWEERRAINAIMIWLGERGASPALAFRIHERFKGRAIQVVSDDPYLLALEVDGVGFITADAIARKVGIAPGSARRAESGVLHVLQEQGARGHVWTSSGEVVRMVDALLRVADFEPETRAIYQAIGALADRRQVHVEPGDQDDGDRVYTARAHAAEAQLARALQALVESSDREAAQAESHAPGLPELVDDVLAELEKETGMRLADAQRAAVEAAARSNVLVVTGGPGTGKTTILRALLALYRAAGLEVSLAAPTGRASQRMGEATRREAKTIHRLLEYGQTGFARDIDNPLEADVVVIDESSMLDLALADHLVAAIPPGARLVFVGDVDQLPSVGPGAVLRDIIASGAIETVRLTQIFRQAEGSLIVENAHRINNGERPVDGTEFRIVECTDQDRAAEIILDLVTNKIPRWRGFDPMQDIQVLCPMRTRGATGARELNQRLQAALNPDGEAIHRGAVTFRVGDRVMQTRNDRDRGVYNGDAGRIVSVDREERSLVVDFGGGREVECLDKHLEKLDLSYAITIHKSQGSEYPVVLVPVLTAHAIMLARNLIYTAVTRAKKLVVLVGDPRAVGMALRETRRDIRRTGLAEKIRGGAVNNTCGGSL